MLNRPTKSCAAAFAYYHKLQVQGNSGSKSYNKECSNILGFFEWDKGVINWKHVCIHFTLLLHVIYKHDVLSFRLFSRGRQKNGKSDSKDENMRVQGTIREGHFASVLW